MKRRRLVQVSCRRVFARWLASSGGRKVLPVADSTKLTYRYVQRSKYRTRRKNDAKFKIQKLTMAFILMNSHRSHWRHLLPDQFIYSTHSFFSMTSYRFEVTSLLSNATLEGVRSTLNMKGVNKELGPLFRMSAPGEWRDRPIKNWPTNQFLFTSWIFLFGIFPFDRHQFYFKETDVSGFCEASSSGTNRIWRHRRSVPGEYGAVTVRDEVSFEPRVFIPGALFRFVARLIFEKRHRYLRNTFGGTAKA